MQEILERISKKETEIMMRNISDKRKLVEISELYSKGLVDLKKHFDSEVKAGTHELSEIKAKCKQLNKQIEDGLKPVESAHKELDKREEDIERKEAEVMKRLKIAEVKAEAVRMSGLGIGQLRDKVRLDLNDISVRGKIAHRKELEANQLVAKCDEMRKTLQEDIELFNKERNEFNAWREDQIIEIESIRTAYQEARVVRS